MPAHLLPVSRRRFLTTSLAAAAGVLTFGPRLRAAGSDVDPDYFVLLADTHIDQNPNRLLRGVLPAVNLEKIVEKITALRPRPTGVILNGDAANIRGLPGEYGLLSWLLRPLTEAGLPVHITMGNHDDREPFYSILSDMKPDTPHLEGRHLAVVETPSVDLVLLDTLDQVNNTPGLLGERQLQWLNRLLDGRREKPVVLFGHHFPETGTGRGLLDMDRLYESILPRPNVKAYFYGHSHRWELGKEEDLHLVNQPATSYVFRQEHPAALVHARFQTDRLRLRLDCLDDQHPWHGQTHELVYR